MSYGEREQQVHIYGVDLNDSVGYRCSQFVARSRIFATVVPGDAGGRMHSLKPESADAVVRTTCV